MMICVGDYVEGCEFYGSHIAYIRGWVVSVVYDSDNCLKSCDIQCDDSYCGSRGNNLIIDSNYPIRKIERVEKWYMRLNRVERGRSYFYRNGLDLKFLCDKDLVRFWDVDGVLAVFAYGRDGVNVCEEENFQDYIKNHNPYMDAVAPEVIKYFMTKCTKFENNYVVSQVYSDEEENKKRDFILKNYSRFIPEENIFFVRSNKKYKLIKEILDSKYNSLDTKHCLIDDSVEVLSLAQENGVCGVHLSSLLLLMNLDEKVNYVEIYD